MVALVGGWAFLMGEVPLYEETLEPLDILPYRGTSLIRNSPPA